MIENNKGITMIALVVTIIVLMILAGASLAILKGDSGIVTQSTKAKKETDQAKYAEEATLIASGVSKKFERGEKTFEELVEDVKFQMESKEYVKEVNRNNISSKYEVLLEVQTDVSKFSLKFSRYGFEKLIEENE